MNFYLRKILLYVMVGVLPFLLSGCFLRLFFGTVAERDTDFGTIFVATFGGTFGPTAICDFDPETGNLVECRYEFLDFEAEPPIFTSTSTAQLIEEFGVLGLFVDPLILQVPVGATNFTGTIDDGSGAQPTVVTEVSSFYSQPGAQISAETGQKFVILEFPSSMIDELTSSGSLDGPFNFNFEFELPSLSSVDVKAMFTGKVEVNGQTFYPPMLPCATDFAEVPAITIPVSPGTVDLMSQVLNILFQNPTLPCDNVVYDFTSGTPPSSEEVALDIKPVSCPNPLNLSSHGSLPVAILGTEDFDVNDIDPASVQLEGISPKHIAVEDVSAPPANSQGVCDCADNGPDGNEDLTLKFNSQDIVGALGPVSHGDEVTLTLTGTLFDGTEIKGEDCIIIKSPEAYQIIGNASGIDEHGLNSFKLYQNYPNPFDLETEIRFYLPEPNQISIRIYDIRGREIRRFLESPYTTGEHTIRWDGKDNTGNPVSSGIYLYQLKANSHNQIKKMSLIR